MSATWNSCYAFPHLYKKAIVSLIIKSVSVIKSFPSFAKSLLYLIYYIVIIHIHTLLILISLRTVYASIYPLRAIIINSGMRANLIIDNFGLKCMKYGRIFFSNRKAGQAQLPTVEVSNEELLDR